MSKHDTWVKLKPGNRYQSIMHLFPMGFPTRDPWPVHLSTEKLFSIWSIDADRLSASQLTAIATIVANEFGWNPQELTHEARQSRHTFSINYLSVLSMTGKEESYARLIELANFFVCHPKPGPKAIARFNRQQHRDWICGDKVPDPIPENYKDIDPRFKSAQLQEAYQQIEADKLLNQGGYPFLDVKSLKPEKENILKTILIREKSN